MSSGPDKKGPNEEAIIAGNFHIAKTDTELTGIVLNTHNVNVPMNNTLHQIIGKTKRKGGSERGLAFIPICLIPSFRVSSLFFSYFFCSPLDSIPFTFVHSLQKGNLKGEHDNDDHLLSDYPAY